MKKEPCKCGREPRTWSRFGKKKTWVCGCINVNCHVLPVTSNISKDDAISKWNAMIRKGVIEWYSN